MTDDRAADPAGLIFAKFGHTRPPREHTPLTSAITLPLVAANALGCQLRSLPANTKALHASLARFKLANIRGRYSRTKPWPSAGR
ncbi:MAG TPA: hypothetical protein VFB06_32565 [Streptosporangiaceae bacterium]|nr:hypothetical protein [Streptosporangiaceae bacterium]